MMEYEKRMTEIREKNEEKMEKERQREELRAKELY
jgi:hypothetical protein